MFFSTAHTIVFWWIIFSVFKCEEEEDDDDDLVTLAILSYQYLIFSPSFFSNEVQE
jgi:hypothetical protein